jgi:hypothetical protein
MKRHSDYRCTHLKQTHLEWSIYSLSATTTKFKSFSRSSRWNPWKDKSLSLSRSSILNVQHTLDKKPLGKIENTVTVEKIHRTPTVATRHTKHTFCYRRAIIWPVPSGNWGGNYWRGGARYRIIRVNTHTDTHAHTKTSKHRHLTLTHAQKLAHTHINKTPKIRTTRTTIKVASISELDSLRDTEREG